MIDRTNNRPFAVASANGAHTEPAPSRGISSPAPNGAPQSGGTGPPLLTPQQAADALAISARTLWSLTERGEVPAVRIGRAVRYAPADLAAYVESRARGGTVAGDDGIRSAAGRPGEPAAARLAE